MDVVTFYTIILYAGGIACIAVFGLFTMRLVKQHKDVYPLLYALEEAERKKETGEEEP